MQPISKTHSLPPQSSPVYRQMMDDQRQHERPVTPDVLPLRPQVYTRQPDQWRMSPDRHTPERQFLGPIPENRQLPPQMVANGVHHHPDQRKSYPASSNHHHHHQQGPFNPAASYQQSSGSPSASYHQQPATQSYDQAQAPIRHPQVRRISPQRRHSDTGLHHRSHTAVEPADRVSSPTPGQQPQMFVAKSMRTSAGISPQRATGPDSRK